jgi:hypothetical protein
MKNFRCYFFLIYILFANVVYGQVAHTNVGQNSGINGDHSSFFGFEAGRFNIGFGNSFFGSNSGRNTTTGSGNIFMGEKSGFTNTIGSNNTFLGTLTGFSNTSGIFNSFIGFESGYFNTTGSHNVFLGHNAGYRNTTGSGNVFLGNVSGEFNLTGFDNTFVGVSSGYKNAEGINNTYLGNAAGLSNSNGNNNTFVGWRTGFFNDGSNNTFIGVSAGHSNKGTGNVFLGFNAGYSEKGSGKLYIHNSPATTPLIYGEFGNRRLGINTKKTEDAGVIYTLSVNGKIRATEVKVYTGWADFVFADDYQLKSLNDVEKFIQENKHLPDVPSEKEVTENGIFLGEMNATLLRKIEELTLYSIEMNKRIEKLEQENQALKKQLRVKK